MTTTFIVNGKVVDNVHLRKRHWNSWPFIVLYGSWLITVVPCFDFLDAFIVLGGILAVHILVFLFTVWSVDFKCLVQNSKVKDILHANACKITPTKYWGSKEVVPLYFHEDSLKYDLVK
ncbi:Cation-transporting P-type ATPase [Artemisia annua]|uniref:Cation-transporting P-type ATPase n=1 Tax=Artemisia annua TaxID=35608 RepID=A0A2U1N7E3_ARTAN|nr:Cation-transporting P-type ATPase [Artemisia annua]